MSWLLEVFCETKKIKTPGFLLNPSNVFLPCQHQGMDLEGLNLKLVKTVFKKYKKQMNYRNTKH